MDGIMNHGDGHGMGGMGIMMTPPPFPSSSSSMNMPHKQKMTMMHMSFYWGNDAQILFSGWPGSSTGMYLSSLLIVFLLAFFVECLSRSRFVGTRVNNGVVSRVLRTLLHAVRMGLAYLVMLAVMSFNVGVFMAAIVGHALGFLVCGSQVFGSGGEASGVGTKHSDLGPMSC